MSLSWGTQYPKLKTNLRLAINRLKMMEKKKTEMAMKSRTEIAEFISARKEDRARIKVEHIIREDYLVEAYEILEMYCDLLLARFGLIEQVKALDEGIAEAVISILWAAPRIATDIAEFKVINDQLTHKYGKPFAEAARGNQLEFPAKVNPRLLAKLSVAAPPKILVERYMILIADSAGVDFTPDRDVMREDEVAQAEQMLIDFKNAGGPPANPPPNDGPSGGSGSGGGGGGYGWQLQDGALPSKNYAQQIPNVPSFGDGQFYTKPYAVPAPPVPPQNYSEHHSPAPNFAQPPVPPPNYNDADSCFYDELDGYSNPKANAHLYDQVPGDHGNGGYEVPNTAPVNLPKIGPNGLPIGGHDANYPYLSQRNSMVEDPKKGNIPTAPPQSLKKPEAFDSEIHFPEPPSNFSTAPSGGNELDFDELARRFDQLKKKP